ncbi:hypothetical protein DRE_01871 [Drechslerella stenobrocha 248]|uniref:Uncharacterized protein n=1 Tax=Drechslerella stenobrocha 248 TaxID=1043628 RepID=W7HYS0_9PEZI|nr:hypothetical protein DRE_01871 [Drechslerella stenobrocha 248]
MPSEPEPELAEAISAAVARGPSTRLIDGHLAVWVQVRMDDGVIYAGLYMGRYYQFEFDLDHPFVSDERNQENEEPNGAARNGVAPLDGDHDWPGGIEMF